MIQKALDMPWRIGNEMRRLLALPYIRVMFALHGIPWGRRWRVLGMPIVQRYRGSTIALGDGLWLRSWRSSNPLVPIHPVVLATRAVDAVIRVGQDCGFTGTTLVSAERIEIGDRVAVGANTTIVDTDFHPLSAEERVRDFLAGSHRPVHVEDDVFIGMNCLILKGVTVGRGTMVGAGSVVSSDVPGGVIVAGNPARVVKEL